MFASIPNYAEFYNEEDVNGNGKGSLNVLNEIIVDFDLVSRGQICRRTRLVVSRQDSLAKWSWNLLQERDALTKLPMWKEQEIEIPFKMRVLQWAEVKLVTLRELWLFYFCKSSII